MKRVLIIRSGAVGDLILTLPVLTALKKRYDGLSIDMMGDPVRLALLKQCGFVDKVLPTDGREFTPLFVPGGALPAHLVRRLRSYDAIITYLPDPYGVFAANLERLASGPVLTGRSRPAEGGRIHMTRVLVDALKPLGIETSVDPPRIDVPESADSDDLCSLENERPQVAIHPGSGGADKCWPVEHYGTLIDLLTESGFRPVITFGPADHTIRSRLLPWIESRDVLVIEDRSLVEVAALYARCRAMTGNDSGMTHLAAAAGTPVIALFGPTDPAVWGTRGKDVRILWGTDVFEADVDGMDWKGPFRPRNLNDIEATAPVRILSRVGAITGTATK